MAKRNRERKSVEGKAHEVFLAAQGRVFQHPVFGPLAGRCFIHWDGRCPSGSWAVVTNCGAISVILKSGASPDMWVYVLAHCLLHLGLGHFQERSRWHEWNVACDLVAARFLHMLKLGRSPFVDGAPAIGAGQTEDLLYERFCRDGIPEHLTGFGATAPGVDDMLWEPDRDWFGNKPDWEALFGEGLRHAVSVAVQVAAGDVESLYTPYEHAQSAAQRAKSWFISGFPLLGALATAFDVVENPRICQQLAVSVAAVDAEQRQVYVNPAANLSVDECRFVMAHELLHVGLRHHARREGRDPFLWNVACDYVINGWLVEMGIGSLPRVGGLYDAEFENESAESIYDRIVNDLRRFRRLSTLRGKGACDMIEPDVVDWWQTRDGVTLDEFYRRCLAQGLTYHEMHGRGLLPAGLVEEIRAQSVPPIPWDVELAQWFDHHFPPLEKRRSYARPSRRQSSTPDIPRPRYVVERQHDRSRTFGVVLDTSGSMDRRLLAQALGAIASYSLARDVPAARVVFCDAAPHDAGAGRVHVKGRGGTVLQPAIDLLERASDFPKQGPILIITDGWIEGRLRIRREHAFLVPAGRYLPFRPVGPVFCIG